MNQHSPLIANADGDQTRPWLHVLYQARRERTVTLVKAAVDRLVGEGKTVTIEAICQVSREVDPEGKGIKKAGVLGNAEAYAYYQQHSTTYQQAHRKLRHAPRQQPTRSTTLPHIDLDRDVTRVHQRYVKLSKSPFRKSDGSDDHYRHSFSCSVLTVTTGNKYTAEEQCVSFMTRMRAESR